MINKISFYVLMMFSGIAIAQDREIFEFEKIMEDKNELLRIINSSGDSIKLRAIKFLLLKEGDINLNTIWYGYTDSAMQMELNASISTKFPPFLYGTNQFVALYLINAIYYSNTKFCQKISVTYFDRKGNKTQTTNLSGKPCPEKKIKLKKRQYMDMCYKVVNSKIVKQMFSDYKIWYFELQKKGFEKVTPPTSDSVRWYGTQ